MIRAFVTSSDQAITAAVREILVQNAVDCPTSQVAPLGQAASRVGKAPLDLVVVVLSPDPGVALTALREIRGATQAHVVAVGPTDDSKLILRTLREGANEYVDEAELAQELAGTLARLRAKTPGQAAAGRLIAVLGPSGGSGSSTLAVNIATALAKEHQTAALYDLKLETGDLATLLDLKPTHTFADLCRNLVRLDRSMFEQLFERHSSGVHLLASPRTLADIAHVTAGGVRQAAMMGRALFPYVVADLDHSFREEQTEFLRQADVVLLVFRLDFTSLRNVRRTQEHLEQLGVSSERVRLVVNRYGQPRELPFAKAEEALGAKIFHYVPDDPKTINGANNKGVPAVLECPSAKVSRSMIEVARSVNGRHDAA